MAENCLFCRIVKGEIPCHKIYEDEEILAFLDIHPIRPGHALVIPKDHHVWFEEIPEPLGARVFAVSQAVGRSLKEIYGVERVGMVFTGIHVPHAHAHLVPMLHQHDVSSEIYLREGPEAFHLPPQPPAEELAGIAEKLRAKLIG